MSKYDTITIREAMNKIAQNQYVLPAIQRKFVWRPEQIEMLFDSLLRNYPINSFMMWEISDLAIQNNYKFYTFIKDYADRFAEYNPIAPTQVLQLPFDAVIDGQQRLTSLYIGLAGTYRYKKAGKWWKFTEDVMPTRKLYLNLTAPIINNIDNEKEYDFRFLSQDEYEYYERNNQEKWFKVGDVLTFTKLNDVNNYLLKNNLISNDFARETLVTLFSKINQEELINCYTERDQDQDKVLNVFLRTNSGGTPLTFSDLLMSIASANWVNLDAREEMKKVIEEVYTYGNPCFDISQDLILKNMLALSDVDLRFKIQNFGKTNVALYERNWGKIKKAIIATFYLLEKLGYNDSILRAKNATIPISYYIYKHDLAESIVKDNYDEEDKKRISTWLNLSLLKGIFGGQSDNVLSTLRDVIKQSSKPKYFPFEEIVDKFKGQPDKNYSFDDEMIKGFLAEQYKSVTGSLILYLLYPDVVLKNGKAIAQDHMHPKVFFEDKKKFNSIGFNSADEQYCMNKEVWNSVKNLQLLSENENKTKLTMSLKDWANNNKKTHRDLFLNDNVSLDIKNFRAFIEDREKNLFDKLKEILR